MWHTDLLPILGFELVLLEGSFTLLDIGFLLVLVKMEDEERELPLEHVLLPLGQLLLAQAQKLLVRLLLQSGALQLLFPTPQLLWPDTRVCYIQSRLKVSRTMLEISKNHDLTFMSLLGFFSVGN